MKKLCTFGLAAALLTAGLSATAEAKPKYHHDRHDHDRVVVVKGNKWKKDRARTIYVIERDRPVRRVVYVDSNDRYYRIVDGRRVYVHGRYYTSYPSRYYYPDGRRRVGISLSF